MNPKEGRERQRKDLLRRMGNLPSEKRSWLTGGLKALLRSETTEKLRENLEDSSPAMEKPDSADDGVSDEGQGPMETTSG